MRKLSIQTVARIACIVALSCFGNAQSANPGANSSADQASVSTAPVKYFSAAEVKAAFDKGATLVDPNGRNFAVITGRREKSGASELHEKYTDVFYIVDGAATYVTGGKLVDGKTVSPGEIRGSGIEGGETRTLAKGDVIVIPAGTPHWFKEVQGPFLYFVVKVQQ